MQFWEKRVVEFKGGIFESAIKDSDRFYLKWKSFVLIVENFRGNQKLPNYAKYSNKFSDSVSKYEFQVKRDGWKVSRLMGSSHDGRLLVVLKKRLSTGKL